MQIGKRGGIGIVASERNNFSWHFIHSLLSLQKAMNLEVIHVQVGNIAEARNFVLKMAKQMNLDYVVMIDSDMTFPSIAVLNLIDAMEKYEAHIGAGLYFLDNKTPAAYELKDKYYPIKDWDKPRLIDACGMGFTLITKELFDITFDWKEGVGEDFAFCQKAKEKGYKIVLDTSTTIGHLRIIPLDKNWISSLKS